MRGFKQKTTRSDFILGRNSYGGEKDVNYLVHGGEIYLEMVCLLYRLFPFLLVPGNDTQPDRLGQCFSPSWWVHTGFWKLNDGVVGSQGSPMKKTFPMIFFTGSQLCLFLCSLTARASEKKFSLQCRLLVLWQVMPDKQCAGLRPLGPLSSHPLSNHKAGRGDSV